MAQIPSSGSMTSPLPEIRKVALASATISRASRCRSERSVRHSLASSTAARARLPCNSCNFPSKRPNSESASAVLPAKPAMILSLYRRRVFFALCLITPSPRVTWPSAVRTTLLSLRTHRTVVPCICSVLCVIGIRRLYSGGAEIEKTPRRHEAVRECKAGSVLVVVVLAGLVFGLFVFFADFFPAFVQGFLGEERVGDIGVVLATVEENLVDLDSVALASDLKGRLDAVHRMVIRIVFDFVGAHARIGVARIDDFADRQVRAA